MLLHTITLALHAVVHIDITLLHTIQEEIRLQVRLLQIKHYQAELLLVIQMRITTRTDRQVIQP